MADYHTFLSVAADHGIDELQRRLDRQTSAHVVLLSGIQHQGQTRHGVPTPRFLAAHVTVADARKEALQQPRASPLADHSPAFSRAFI